MEPVYDELGETFRSRGHLAFLRDGHTDLDFERRVKGQVHDALGKCAANDGVGTGLGEFLCMIAALTYAFAIILTDRLSKKHDPMSLGVLYVGFMGIMGLVSSFIFETPSLPASGGQWAALLALALLCTAFGFAMQPIAQKPLSSEATGIICALNPLTTAVLGWILMGDALGACGILGAVLIIGGIILPHLGALRSALCSTRGSQDLL